MNETVAHTQHHGDDRPPHANLFRVRHDGTETELDSPATVTLHAATFAGRVVSLRSRTITFDHARARDTGPLVLIDAMELAWQRAEVPRS